VKPDYVEKNLDKVRSSEVAETLSSLAEKLEMENWGGEQNDVYRVDNVVGKLEIASPDELTEEAESEFGIDRCLEHDHDFL